MREIRVLVRVQVDECESNAHFDREMMEDAAVEAVENVMRHATGVGFPHTYEEELSICFVDAVLYEEPGDDDSDGADEE
jgi:hypothetical protein